MKTENRSEPSVYRRDASTKRSCSAMTIRLCCGLVAVAKDGPKGSAALPTSPLAIRRLSWRSQTWHGLARAVRRGLANMKIQAYLTAAAINRKRLAAALLAILLRWLVPSSPLVVPSSRRSVGFDVRAITGLIAA